MKSLFKSFLLLPSLIFAQSTCYELAGENFYLEQERSDLGKTNKLPFNSKLYLKKNPSKVNAFDIDIYNKTNLPYMNYYVIFACEKNEEANNFYCYQSDDGGEFKIKENKNSLSFSINNINVGDTRGTQFYYRLFSNNKKENFLEAKTIPCKEIDAKLLEKERLYRTIRNKDYLVYDIDYNDKFAIAVGETDTIEDQKAKMKDEHYNSLILLSKDKGKTWHKIQEGESIPLTNALVLPNNTFIVNGSMEGAGGLILKSENLGESWKSHYTGMLHSLEFKKGLLIGLFETVATKITSDDFGDSWKESKF